MQKIKGKKGQVGDTITWIVATIIIVVMLVIFIIGASLLADTKALYKFRDKIISPESELDYDFALSNSLYTYFKVDNSKQKTEFHTELEKREMRGEFADSLSEREAELKWGLYG